MMFLKKIKAITPFLILFILVVILAVELYYANPRAVPSALLGAEIPQFSIPNLYTDTQLTQQELKAKVTLLNVWASWCDACLMEHEMLMRIHSDYAIPIIGLVYKDQPKKAKLWLKQYGNPYTQVGYDVSGDTAMDFGVYGTPETFLIRDGKIVYRHIGPIDQETWDKTLYPIIKEHY